MFDMADWDKDEPVKDSESSIQPIYVTGPAVPELEFSVVTLLVSDDNYRRMLRSFEDKGFGPDNTEFVAIDNRQGNKLDGYQALRAVAPQLRGRFVLFAHDDIELTADGYTALHAVLTDLEARDPLWMVAGNSGLFTDTLFAHLDDPHGTFRLPGNTPQQVRTLDENFLVMPRARMVFPSVDLKGFHLFGTDICLHAGFAGGTAYTIPFLLTHHSGGKPSPEFRATKARIENKYARFGIRGLLKAPSSDLHFGWQGSVLRKTNIAATWLRQKTGRLAQIFARSARENTETK
ncbi:MAG: hypothetical protein KJO67_14725 [Silicimonas sp.]|nr:hypothetical protein [Silicimonas sp.]